jgi:hypothetical protein
MAVGDPPVNLVNDIMTREPNPKAKPWGAFDLKE